MAATHLVRNTAALKRVLWLERKSRVVIGSSRLAHMERKSVQERMNRLLGESGYGLGLAATVAALVFAILWIGGHWGFFLANWIPTTGLCATACLFAGGLGRAIGFLYARWRLARVIWMTMAEMDCAGDAQGIRAHRSALLKRKTMAQ